MSALKIPALHPTPVNIAAEFVRRNIIHSSDEIDVARVLGEHMSPLKWSAMRPKSPGFYWVKAERLTARITDFHLRGSMIVCGYDDLNHYGTPMFAGPIKEPS